jgi:hypothetical protein
VLIPECPLCGGTERYYSFVAGTERFDECRDCRLLSHKAVNGGEASEEIEYGADVAEVDEPELVTAFFSLLARYLGPGGGDRRMGVLGKTSPLFLEEARRHGYHVSAIREGAAASGAYEVVAVMNALENTATPVAFAESLRDHLCDGGVVAIVTRQLVKVGWQVGSGAILGRRQRYSFSDTNLQTILWKARFADAFLSHHVGQNDRIRAQGWFKDHAIAFARMRARRSVPTLSVVLPVYNEASTVGEVLEALAAKQIPGVDIEVIVVESASTDGSRELVLAYQDRPRFRVILEDRPRGKGFAVRTGLRQAKGDIILIQDADLEYDFLDYEMLIGPILRGRAAFVLGTRHAGHWKIRRFARHYLANAMNLAHWFLVYVMNQLYVQSMTDPFTMFKVFRADCLTGLDFECNRFDFDVELVCKLLRKGYDPLEIPVNYRARSFEEGKKVRIFRDPLTWVRAMLKYRSAPVLHMPALEVKAQALPGPSRVVNS